MHRLTAAVIAGAVVLGVGLAHVETAAAQAAKTVRTLPAPTNTGPGPTEANYVIGAQDMLEIDVFQIGDLSRTTQVDAAGNIRMPLLGEVTAAGRTPAQLSTELSTKLTSYVKDPKVTVTVKESSNRRVTVDGAVVKPGIYPMTGPTTLLQAVALAEGPDTRVANIKKVAIFRNVNNQRQAAIFDLAAIRAGKASDPQVYPNDVVVVETSGTRSFLRDLSNNLPFFSVFRPY